MTTLPVNCLFRKKACASDSDAKGNDRATRGLIVALFNQIYQSGNTHRLARYSPEALILEVKRSQIKINNGACNRAGHGVPAKRTQNIQQLRPVCCRQPGRESRPRRFLQAGSAGFCPYQPLASAPTSNTDCCFASPATATTEPHGPSPAESRPTPRRRRRQ